MASSLFARAFGVSFPVRSSRTAVSAGFRYCRFNSTIAPANERTPKSFTSLKGAISDRTFEALVGDPMKLQTMTHVQEEVLSLLPALAEPYDPESKTTRDLLVRAKTGTGKTIAFLVPAIEARLRSMHEAGKQAVVDAGLVSDSQLERRARQKFQKENVGALILSPTRELATQIANEAIKLLHHHPDMHVVLFTGGINKRMQMRDWMRNSRDIVVATTGRLRDLMESEPDVLKSIKGAQTFILDEADTMLEMGFRDDIHAIQSELIPSPRRQTLLFSATLSPVIRQVANSVLSSKNQHIDCVKTDDSPVHAHVPQYHTVLPNASSQIPHILRLIAHDQLTNPKQSKIILFLPTTKMTQLFATIVRETIDTLPIRPNLYEIHSKRVMESRVNASNRFRQDTSPSSILISSDVSARGVDYPGVTRVIQVGVPTSTDQYVHRVGRTGRQGSTVGRGDLVLLPWEVGFITWQLTEVPIKPLTTGEVKAQLEELARKADNGEIELIHSNKRDRASSSPSSSSSSSHLTSRLSDFDTAPVELLSRFDPTAIRETFLSLLGYYFGRSGELRVQKGVILGGCGDWTTQACGLPNPPFVSQEFLARLGLGDGESSTRKWGMNNVNRRSRPSPGEAVWMGRGNVKRKRFERDGEGQYAGDSRQGQYAGDRRQGQYAGDRRQGSYAGDRRQGSYAGGRRQGSYASDSRQGSYAGGSRQGSYAGGSRQGQYAGGSRQGQYAGGSRQGQDAGGSRAWKRESFGGAN